MRLWHKDLIDSLPQQQLIAQWRECCLIAKNISEKGKLNHILVNPVMDYDINHFSCYSSLVAYEMLWRGYTCNEKSFTKYLPLWSTEIERKDIFCDWHNKRYLTQCYYNLQEKFDRGGISEKEWEKVNKKYYEVKEKYSNNQKEIEEW